MKIRSINWPLWFGFLLSFFVFISYPTIFVQWPVTRDMPWASILLALITIGLLVAGIRRGFAVGRPKRSRIAAIVLPAVSLLVLGLFVFTTFVRSRWLPASSNAPQVGRQAPDFILKDTNERDISLSQILSEPINGKPTKGVLLIFYRGYW